MAGLLVLDSLCGSLALEATDSHSQQPSSRARAVWNFCQPHWCSSRSHHAGLAYVTLLFKIHGYIFFPVILEDTMQQQASQVSYFCSLSDSCAFSLCFWFTACIANTSVGIQHLHSHTFSYFDRVVDQRTQRRALQALLILSRMA